MSDFLYRGEAQLASWSNTSSGGAKITLWLPDSDALAPFMAITERKGGKAGQILPIIVGHPIYEHAEPKKEEKKPEESSGYGEYYRNLYRIGFFNNPKLIKLAGTDAEYQEFVRLMPSVVSGEYSEYVDGVGYCEYCHIRRAGHSGTGYKGDFCGVPMTHAEHALQHQKGYSAVHPDGIDWFEKKAAECRREFVRDWLHLNLECDSLADVHPDTFCNFLKSHGIEV